MSLLAVSNPRVSVVLLLIAGTMVFFVGVLPMARGDAGGSSPAAFAGKFSSDSLTVELSESGGGYVGTVMRGNDSFPARATAAGQQLTGTFVASGAEFPFTATLADGRLLLVSGGTTYSLSRVAVNPLVGHGAAAPVAVAPVPAAPLAAAPADGAAIDDSQSFGDFTVLGSTPAGKTLYMALPGAQTLEAAMTKTADALGKVFDAKPLLSGAFADSKGRNKGGVNLSAKLHGKDIRGVIFCGVGPNGGSATVIITYAGASKDDFTTLMSFMPAPMNMQTYKFPDGSGSIDLPEGWTTPTQSATHGILVVGPAGQLVVYSSIRSVNEPECRLVRISRQNDQMAMQNYQTMMRMYQQSQQMHQRFPNTIAIQPPPKPVVQDPDPNVRFPGIDFCPFCDGVDQVLKVWHPLMEEKQKRLGKPYTHLDKVIEIFPADPNPLQPKSKSGLAYIAVTDHDGDKVTHLRVLNRITTAPIVDGEVWQLCMSAMRAPDATFDRDLPVMSAIMNSVTLDMNVVNGEMNAESAAIRKMGEDMNRQLVRNGEAFRDQQARSFNAHQHQIAAQEKARHDSASDFIEYIGGVRHVYDTKTGENYNVDLFNSNGIVNGLNEGANDPNRYVQIPLRYER